MRKDGTPGEAVLGGAEPPKHEAKSKGELRRRENEKTEPISRQTKWENKGNVLQGKRKPMTQPFRNLNVDRRKGKTWQDIQNR